MKNRLEESELKSEWVSGSEAPVRSLPSVFNRCFIRGCVVGIAKQFFNPYSSSS